MKSRLMLTLLATTILWGASCEKQNIEPLTTIDTVAEEKVWKTGKGNEEEDDDEVFTLVSDGTTGSSLAGAQVEAIPDGGGVPIEIGTTNSEGEYTFTIPAGNYVFKVIATGYPVWESSLIEVTNGSQVNCPI